MSDAAIQFAFEDAGDRATWGKALPAELPFPDDRVQWARQVTDDLDVVESIEGWKKAAHKGQGGRPETFPLNALVVAMVLCATYGEPMTAARFYRVLFHRIGANMRSQLGVPVPPSEWDRKAQDACYRNVRTRLHTMLAVMDPSIRPKNLRVSGEEFEAEMTRRAALSTPEDLLVRYDRLAWFANRLLEVSIQRLPRDIRRHWRGSVCIDATPVHGLFIVGVLGS